MQELPEIHLIESISRIQQCEVIFQVELLSLRKRVQEAFNQVDIHNSYIGVERQ